MKSLFFCVSKLPPVTSGGQWSHSTAHSTPVQGLYSADKGWWPQPRAHLFSLLTLISGPGVLSAGQWRPVSRLRRGNDPGQWARHNTNPRPLLLWSYAIPASLTNYMGTQVIRNRQSTAVKNSFHFLLLESLAPTQCLTRCPLFNFFFFFKLMKRETRRIDLRQKTCINDLGHSSHQVYFACRLEGRFDLTDLWTDKIL